MPSGVEPTAPGTREFRPISPGGAWEQFRSVPYLEFGIESRSDCVEGILLFVPPGSLMMATPRANRRGLLSLTVGFAQPRPLPRPSPRTPSPPRPWAP
jgi:hypothetical protein